MTDIFSRTSEDSDSRLDAKEEPEALANKDQPPPRLATPPCSAFGFPGYPSDASSGASSNPCP